MTGHFLFILFLVIVYFTFLFRIVILTLQVSCMHYDFWSCVSLAFLSVCMSGSLHLSLLLVLFLGFFPFCLFKSYYGSFYSYPLDACLFSSERQKMRCIQVGGLVGRN